MQLRSKKPDRLVAIGAVVTLGLAALAAQSTHDARAQSACRVTDATVAERINGKLNSALRTGNAIELRLLYASDAVLISPAHLTPRDRTQDLSRYLQNLATRLRLIETRQETLRSGCNTVVAYGAAKFAGRSGGRMRTFWMQYSRVFERRQGAWLVTVDHMSAQQANQIPSVTMPAAAARPRIDRAIVAKPAPVATLPRSQQGYAMTGQRLGHPTTQRVRARERDQAGLAALVKSIAPDASHLQPQVRGVAVRSNDGVKAEPILPPQPKLVERQRVRKTGASRSNQTRRRRRASVAASRKSRADWKQRVPGFYGFEY